MIGKTLPEYIFIRAAITALRLVAPVSILYLVVSAYRHSFLISPWISFFTIPEALFHLFVFLPRRKTLAKPATYAPQLLTKEERKALFTRCFRTVFDISQWFLCSDILSIKRENVIDWLLWGFFSHDGKNADEMEQWRSEIDDFISALEVKALAGANFEEGRNKSINCMRLTFDPVVVLHRPLIWYTIVCFVDMYTAGHLASLGFRHYAPKKWFQAFPPRPFSIFSRASTGLHVPYWYRPHRSTIKNPVIFIHGIGIGLYPYISFLRGLVASDPDVGILLIEILPISMRMTSMPVLPRPAMLDEFYAITSSLNITRAVLASHSYGTVVAGHIMRSQQATEGPPPPTKITAYCFIDPIPFLLHLPDITYNFLYRTPKDANEWLLWYFASRDADVGRTLARHFFWAENVMWKEDLEGENAAVVLSGEDQIVPTRKVWEYLTDQPHGRERWVKEDGKLEVLYFDGADHATVFAKRTSRTGMTEVLQRFSRIDVMN
ncbi:uncharacterized protein BT62DRAFT_951638 [Guyanagaster necrorhizus]|uniref:AB hydrolase-1 domain-containing protein n=1 Tax=Guyanagaster necrorhizus TaxID=856835 RepID=A0A9P7VQL6_9AGAR|nr:uncharacterized protein BT62DRAFT_951638 [Guyanagaster necrorhizus MCA 3950]KAG7444645.1 hypothetical protein BT62DRAFT_951638 [Guyanagaster necrorhizus MCA 3950]